MSDVHCKFCGEPFDLDCFHNGTESFSELYSLFCKYGCGVMDDILDGKAPVQVQCKKCNSSPLFDFEVIDAIRVITHINGDDADGASSDTWFYLNVR